jgi:hypothetical protein
MGNIARVIVTTQPRSADPPKDFVDNTLHFQAAGTPAGTDWQSLADAVKAAMYKTSGSGNPFVHYGGRAGTIKVYDLADPKPRPERGVSIYTPGSFEALALGPRCTALCLSFYSDRNLKHQRGRIYIGPFNASDQTEKPSTPLMTEIAHLGDALYAVSAAAGPAGWLHGVYSEVQALFYPANHYWCNDVWDVMRSRLPKELIREHAVIG